MKKNDSFRKKTLMSSFLLGLFLVLFGFSAKGQSSYVVLDEGFDKAPSNISLKSGFGSGIGVWFDTIVSTPVENPGNWIISGWGTPTGNPSISTNAVKGVLKFGYTSNTANKDTVTPFITTCPINLKDAGTFNLHLHCFADGSNPAKEETLEIYLDDKLVKEVSISKIYKIKTGANIAAADLFNTLVLTGLDATNATDTSRITMKITGYGLTKNIRVAIYLDRMIVTKGVDGSPYPTSIKIDNIEKYIPAPDTLPLKIYDLRNFVDYYTTVFPTGTTGTKPVSITAQPNAKIKVTAENNTNTTITGSESGMGSLSFNISVPGRANVEILSADSVTTASYIIGVVDAAPDGRIGTKENPYTSQDILYYGKYAVYGYDVNGENKYWVRGYVKGDANANNGAIGNANGVIRLKNSATSGVFGATAISVIRDTLVVDTMFNAAEPKHYCAKIATNADSVLICGYYGATVGVGLKFGSKGAWNYMPESARVFGKDVLFYGFSTPRFKPDANQWLTTSWEYTSLDSVTDFSIYEPSWDLLKINGTPYAYFNKLDTICTYGHQKGQAFPTITVVPSSSEMTVTYVPENGIPTSWDDTVKAIINYLGTDKTFSVVFKAADTTLITLNELNVVNGTSTATTSGMGVDGVFKMAPAFNKDSLIYTLRLAAKQNIGNIAINGRLGNSTKDADTLNARLARYRMTLVNVSNIAPIPAGTTKAVQVKEIAEDTTYQRIYTINITAEDTSYDASIYKVNSLALHSDTLKPDGARSSTKEFGQTYEPSNFKTLLRTNVPDTIKVTVPFNKNPQVYVSQTILEGDFELYMNHPNAVVGGLERVDNLYKDPDYPNYFEHYIRGVVLKANESAIYRKRAVAEDGVTESKSVYVQVTRLPNTDPGVDSIGIFAGGNKLIMKTTTEPKTYEWNTGSNAIASVDSIVGFPVSYGKVRLDTINNADSTIWSGGGQVATIGKTDLQTDKGGFVNEFKLYSVAQDGIARDTITVKITRPADTDSSTRDINVLPLTSNPEFFLKSAVTLEDVYFNKDSTEYLVYANTTDFPLYISTVPTNSAASSTIDTVYATEVSEGKYEDKSSWHAATVYTIAEDGTENPVHYTVFVGHRSSNNYLSDLKVGGTTIEGFDKDVLMYNYIPTGTTVPVVTATKGSQYANEPVVTPAANIGDTTFVTVTAQSGEERIYAIAMLSTDTTLSSLEVVGQTLTPEFASTTFAYTVSGIERDITEVTINATATYATVDGDGVVTLSTESDTTTRVVTVTAQNGDLGHYTLTLIKRPIATDATLSALGVTGQTLTPAFAPTTFAYTVSEIERNITSVTVTATANEPHAIIVGAVSVTLSMTSDTTYATVNVTAEDEIATETYTITLIKRAARTDATLSALGVTGYTLDPEFVSTTTAYTVREITGTTATVTATPTDANANVEGAEVVNLTGDTTTAIVKVIAEDGTTEKEYTLTLIKKATGIEDVNALANVSLYPNPVVDIVSVNLEKVQEKVTINVYNAAGTLVSAKIVNGGSVQSIDLSKLAKGAYSVVIATENGSVTEKITKQ